MTALLFYRIYFLYIAFTTIEWIMFVICYISEIYLFAVANNVGFLKRFAGL
mgnify:CR=1 FL=1|jgi:hypothetical protein